MTATSHHTWWLPCRTKISLFFSLPPSLGTRAMRSGSDMTVEANVTAIKCSATAQQAALDNGAACNYEEMPDKPVI